MTLTREELHRELGAAATALLNASKARNRHRTLKDARVQARREEDVRFVYVMGPVKGPLKIGVALDVRKRRKALQTASPKPLKIHFKALCPPGCFRQVEAECHKALHRHRLSGEWFAVEPDDAIAIVKATIERFA